jgi:hypothetical protein
MIGLLLAAGRRVLRAVVLLLVVLVVLFAAVAVLPGDPATIILGAVATRSEIDALRHELRLDQPGDDRAGLHPASVQRARPSDWRGTGGLVRRTMHDAAAGLRYVRRHELVGPLTALGSSAASRAGRSSACWSSAAYASSDSPETTRASAGCTAPARPARSARRSRSPRSSAGSASRGSASSGSRRASCSSSPSRCRPA